MKWLKAAIVLAIVLPLFFYWRFVIFFMMVLLSQYWPWLVLATLLLVAWLLRRRPQL